MEGPMPDAPLDALRFLIVDDEIIVALDLEYMLNDLGHSVVGTANRVDRGMEMARTSTTIDMAILDINVRGVLSFPIAEILRDRGVPVIFVSGYGKRSLTDAFRNAHFLTKPFDINGLAHIVQKARSDAILPFTDTL
jgi:two-component SAPR family response regulator